jgi:Protein of unknown function (DUF3788)
MLPAVPLSFFPDKSTPPSDETLRATLAGTAGMWKELIARLAEHFPPVDVVWGFTSKKIGWSARINHGKRTIVYLLPADGWFQVSLALGEKAAAAARASELRDAILPLIEAAPKYAEGRGIRFEIHPGDDDKVVIAETLALLKMAH